MFRLFETSVREHFECLLLVSRVFFFEANQLEFVDKVRHRAIFGLSPSDFHLCFNGPKWHISSPHEFYSTGTYGMEVPLFLRSAHGHIFLPPCKFCCQIEIRTTGDSPPAGAGTTIIRTISRTSKCDKEIFSPVSLTT
jgi:hypothetical protein